MFKKQSVKKCLDCNRIIQKNSKSYYCKDCFKKLLRGKVYEN